MKIYSYLPHFQCEVLIIPSRGVAIFIHWPKVLLFSFSGAGFDKTMLTVSEKVVRKKVVRERIVNDGLHDFAAGASE